MSRRVRCAAALLLSVSLLLPFFVGVSRAETDMPYAVGAQALSEAPVRKAGCLAALEMQTQTQLDSFSADTRFTPTGGTHALMTAYIAATELTLEKTITDSIGFSSISDSLPDSGLRKGDTAKVSDLISAALLCGAQDAALMLAHGVSEDEAAFVQKMNEYAEQLGMQNTHYTKAAGSVDTEEYTTAADLIRLGRAAAAIPGFAALTSAYRFEPDTNGNHFNSALTATLRLLYSDSSKYDARIKALLGAGFSNSSAGYSVVLLAELNGMQTLCVVSTKENRDDSLESITGVLDYLEKSFGTADCAASVAQLLNTVTDEGVTLAGDLQGVSVPVVKKQESVINPLDLSYTLSAPLGEAIVGEVYKNAVVMLGEAQIATVPMRVASVDGASDAAGAGEPNADATPETPKPTAKPITVEHFSKSDERYTPSLQERFGWVLFVGLAVLVSAAAIAVGSIIGRWRR